MTRMELLANQSRIDSYCDRIKAAGLNIDIQALKKRLEKLDSKFLTESLNKIVSGKGEMVSSLTALGVNPINNKISMEQAKEEVKNKLNLSDIVEFENGHKKYFKFKDKDGNIFITRNMGDDSKQMFLDILSSTSIADKDDKKENANNIFNYLREYKLIEIGLNSSNSMENITTSNMNRAVVEELQAKYPNREIVYSPQENFYIIKGIEEEKDIILSFEKINGKMSMTKLEQKGYEDKEVKLEEDQANYGEEGLETDITNDEDITKIIIDNFESGIDDDMTIIQIIQLINSKYPNYKDQDKLTETVITYVDNARRLNNLAKNNSYQKKLVLNQAA